MAIDKLTRIIQPGDITNLNNMVGIDLGNGYVMPLDYSFSRFIDDKRRWVFDQDSVGSTGTGATASAVVGVDSVTRVDVLNRGSGYSDATIAFTSNPGTGATVSLTATANADAFGVGDTGTITNISVTNGGSGYSDRLTFTITSHKATGTGANFSVELVSGSVFRVNVLDGGTNYRNTSDLALQIKGGSGTGAAIRASVINGRINNVNVQQGGNNYTYPITISVKDNDRAGTAAALTATLSNNAITAINVTDGGSQFIGFTMNISGSNTSARLSPRLSGGSVVGVDVLDGGSGYSGNQHIVTNSYGSRAASYNVVVSNGAISAVNVTDGGAGYPHATITLADLSGTGATAVAKLSNETITAINVTDGGAGYGQPPTVVITSNNLNASGAMAIARIGGVRSINVHNGGSGYSENTQVTLPPNSDGIRATAVPVITNGVITAINVTDGSYNYLSPPPVTITDTPLRKGIISANSEITPFINTFEISRTGNIDNEDYELITNEFTTEKNFIIPGTDERFLVLSIGVWVVSNSVAAVRGGYNQAITGRLDVRINDYQLAVGPVHEVHRDLGKYNNLVVDGSVRINATPLATLPNGVSYVIRVQLKRI